MFKPFIPRDFKNYTEKKLIRPGPTRPDRRRTVVKELFFLIFLMTSRGVIGRTVYSRPRIFIYTQRTRYFHRAKRGISKIILKKS